MSIQIGVGGVVKQVTSVPLCIGGVIKSAVRGHHGYGGLIKTFYGLDTPTAAYIEIISIYGGDYDTSTNTISNYTSLTSSNYTTYTSTLSFKKNGINLTVLPNKSVDISANIYIIGSNSNVKSNLYNIKNVSGTCSIPITAYTYNGYGTSWGKMYLYTSNSKMSSLYNGYNSTVYISQSDMLWNYMEVGISGYKGYSGTMNLSWGNGTINGTSVPMTLTYVPGFTISS